MLLLHTFYHSPRDYSFTRCKLSQDEDAERERSHHISSQLLNMTTLIIDLHAILTHLFRTISRGNIFKALGEKCIISSCADEYAVCVL